MKPNQIDYALIRQIRILNTQAENTIKKLGESRGVKVSVDIDNATQVLNWRSMQTCELKTKKIRTILYNN